MDKLPQIQWTQLYSLLAEHETQIEVVKLALNAIVHCQNHRPVCQILSNQKKRVTSVLVNNF